MGSSERRNNRYDEFGRAANVQEQPGSMRLIIEREEHRARTDDERQKRKEEMDWSAESLFVATYERWLVWLVYERAAALSCCNVISCVISFGVICETGVVQSTISPFEAVAR
jgi:hypothetical protein